MRVLENYKKINVFSTKLGGGNAIVAQDLRRVDYWTAETAKRAAEAWNETAVAEIICVCPACPVRAHNNAHCL